jgi:hypothetical protein
VITPRFLDPLVLEEIGENRWRLVHELRYDSAILGARVIVDVGFETDLSSIPRLPIVYWAVGGRGRKAGVVHDWLYRTHVGGRAIADRVYPEALSVSEDVPAAVRWAMWAGLRVGGWMAWEH